METIKKYTTKYVRGKEFDTQEECFLAELEGKIHDVFRESYVDEVGSCVDPLFAIEKLKKTQSQQKVDEYNLIIQTIQNFMLKND